MKNVDGTIAAALARLNDSHISDAFVNYSYCAINRNYDDLVKVRSECCPLEQGLLTILVKAKTSKPTKALVNEFFSKSFVLYKRLIEYKETIMFPNNVTISILCNQFKTTMFDSSNTWADYLFTIIFNWDFYRETVNSKNPLYQPPVFPTGIFISKNWIRLIEATDRINPWKGLAKQVEKIEKIEKIEKVEKIVDKSAMFDLEKKLERAKMKIAELSKQVEHNEITKAQNPMLNLGELEDIERLINGLQNR